VAGVGGLYVKLLRVENFYGKLLNLLLFPDKKQYNYARFLTLPVFYKLWGFLGGFFLP
jgi:hypothetical protein